MEINKVALENVKADLLIKKNKYKDAELEAIKDNRVQSQVQMYHDMSKLYSDLLKQLVVVKINLLERKCGADESD